MTFIAQHDPTLLGDTALLPALEHIIPPAQIAAAVAAHTPPGSRRRKLFGDRLVTLLIAAFLLPMPALDHALDLLLLSHVPSGGGEPPATKGAISRARRRWGTAPFVTLFRTVCRPLATQEEVDAWRFGLRVMAIDGTCEDVADTPENAQVFGRQQNGKRASVFPLLHGVYLVECGTRVICDAVFAPCHTGERTLARRLLRSVTREMLLLWDQGFHGYPLVAAARSCGAHLVCRIPFFQTIVPELTLPDGSFLARLYARPPSRRTRRTPFLRVRIITYTLDDDPRTQRLLTTLLDHTRAPALEVVATYHERWEVELAVDELKTHLHLAPGPFRSPTPLGVRQEAYALLLAHYCVRAFLLEAARAAGIDPDRLSFTRTVRLLDAALLVLPCLPPAARSEVLTSIRTALARSPLPRRDGRSNPRVVRRLPGKYRICTDPPRRQQPRPPFTQRVHLVSSA